MTVSRIAPLALLLALALTLPAKAQDSQLKIAIADPSRIFNEMQETKDVKQSMEMERKRVMGEARDKEEKVNALKEVLDQLKPDSPQYHEKNREYVLQRVDFEVWGKAMEADSRHQSCIQIKQLFDKIQSAINEVAASKGIDLVLNDNRPTIPDDMEKITPEQLRAIILSRTVMFAGPKVDLTNDVLVLLNARYAAGKPTTTAN